MRSVLIVIFVFFYLLLGLPVLGAMWIIHKFAPTWADMAQLRLVQWAFRVIIFLSGADIEFIGEENVPKDEAVLYIGNHRSFFDIIITYSRCPRLTGYISKQSITKIPVLGLWMKRLHCLFLDRDDIKQGLKVVLAAIDQVKSGISICVFPEGTRCKNKDDLTEVQPFKEGTFKIATKSKCKIVPMAIMGTNEIFENHLPWVKKSHVVIRYGTPIDPATLSKEAQKHLGAHCREVIVDMLKEMV